MSYPIDTIIKSVDGEIAGKVVQSERIFFMVMWNDGKKEWFTIDGFKRSKSDYIIEC